MAEAKKKNGYVYKSNMLARYGQYFLEGYRYELMKTTALEKNVLTYALSLLDQDGDLSQPVIFDIDDYWERIGIQPTGGNYYTMVMEAVKALRDRSTLVKKIKPDTGEVYYESASWVERYSIENEGRTWVLWFDHNLENELLRLKDNMTKFLPEYIFRLRTAYGKELYEILCAEEYKNTTFNISLDDLKKRLGVITNYKLTADFRRFVIDAAVNDINENSLDITVSYKLIKTGRTYTHVEFTTKRLFGECASMGDSPEKIVQKELKQQLRYEDLSARIDAALLGRAIEILTAAKIKLQQGDSTLPTKFRTSLDVLRSKITELDGATLLTCLQSSVGDRLAESEKADMLFLSRLFALETYVTIEEHDKETDDIRYQIRYDEIVKEIENGIIKGSLPHLDVIVRIMRDVIFRPKKKYEFYKGTDDQIGMAGAKLRKEYLSLTKKHIVYALEQVYATGKPIKSPTTYFLPVLHDALYSAWASENGSTDCLADTPSNEPQVNETTEKVDPDVLLDTREMPFKEQMVSEVKLRVSYDVLRTISYHDDPTAQVIVDTLVDVVAETLSSTKSRIKINGKPMVADSVKEVLNRITNQSALNVIERHLLYRDQVAPEKQREYLLTAIYQEIISPSVMGEDDES